MSGGYFWHSAGVFGAIRRFNFTSFQRKYQAKLVLRHVFFFAKRVSRYVLSYYNKLLFLFADSKLKHTNNCMHICILETSESIINKIVID